MARIKLTQESRVLLPAGAEVETSDDYARRLVELGRAEIVKAQKAKTKTKAKED